MQTKELSEQEQEVVDDLLKEQAELSAQQEVLEAERSLIYQRLREIGNELAEIKSPWKTGDIVQDEKGIQYRVTHSHSGRETRPYGIRLQKSGAEAHKDPRTIWSNELTLVERTGD
jgi:hypothetical protein